MNENKSGSQLKGVLILLITAFIWGISFVAQSAGAECVEPFTFMGVRSVLGGLALIPVILVKDKITARTMTEEQLSERKAQDKKTVLCGLLVGVFLAIATNFQQFAFNYSTAGKIAFVTAMYMFFIPIVSVFLHKKVGLVTWICVVLGFTGLYFLCFKGGEGFSVNKGDFLAFICSMFFTVQILLLEKFSPYCDGVKLSCVEFFTAGIISLILMAIFEHPELAAIKKAAIPILYSGLGSCGIAYTLQTVGQKYCEATIGSLVMCMESVFAVLASAIILHEMLSGREILGCAIMFSAILISQIWDIIKNRHK